MKKAIFTALIVIGAIFSLAIACHAADYTIPQAYTPPTIDGKETSDDEWANAYHRFLSFETADWSGCVLGDRAEEGVINGSQPEDACKGYDVYIMYYNDPDEENKIDYEVKQGGIYIKVVAQDKTRGAALSDAKGAYNATDVVQLAICPINSKSRPSNSDKSFLYDLPFFTAMDTTNSDSNFYEHYQFKAGKSLIGSLGVKTASTISADGYFFEVMIPWKGMNIGNRLPKHTPGSMMGMGIVIMDWVGMSPFYELADFGAGTDFLSALQNARKYNTITFGEMVNVPAGQKGDTSALKASIAAVASLNQNEYTDATWAAMQAALDHANALTEADAQSTIDAAKTQLDNAINSLLKIADATPFQILQATIASVANYVETDYEPDLWAIMQTALTAAQAITEQNTPEEISAANDVLTAAIEKMLNPIDADLSNLTAAINAAKMMKENDFSTEDWLALQAALTDAAALSEKSSQYEVDKAVEAINSIMSRAIDSSDKKPADKPATVEAEEEPSFPWLVVVIAVVVLAAAAIVVVLVLMNKKKQAVAGVQSQETPAEIPVTEQNDSETEKTTSEEAPEDDQSK